MIKKIKSLFKKANIKVTVEDDSIKLKYSEIKLFLDKELKEKIITLNNTLVSSSDYYSYKFKDFEEKLEKTKSKYKKDLEKLYKKLELPSDRTYFNMHIFSAKSSKEISKFLYDNKDLTKSFRELLLIQKEIVDNIKKSIDHSRLLFYDVVLEEIKNSKTIISKATIEAQIFELTYKKVTILN